MKKLFERLLASCFRISTQLQISIGGAVAITVIASLIGWVSFDRVGDVQRRVNDDSVPEMEAAFSLARQTAELIDAAPLLASATTPRQLTRIADEIAGTGDSLQQGLTTLAALTGESTTAQSTRFMIDALISNIGEIEALRVERFELSALRLRQERKLVALEGELSNLMASLSDDQLFYIVTGRRNLDDPPDPKERYFRLSEFDQFRHFEEIRFNIAAAVQILSIAFSISDVEFLEPLRERFEAVSRNIRWHTSQVEPKELRERLEPRLSAIIRMSADKNSSFGMRVHEIELENRQQQLIATNRLLARRLAIITETLIGSARKQVEEATKAANKAVMTGQNLLFLINIIGIIGAILVAWLFIGRFLSRRLALLSNRMRDMADGNIESEVVVEGRDEIADMSSALEVFRRHAVEVQRLNLVEQMAGELSAKNDRLESTLNELERTQDQMVMREKLAALGELTAGVAHEIKNPLNFIKNFSEVSVELLEEMLEEIPRVIGPHKAKDDAAGGEADAAADAAGDEAADADPDEAAAAREESMELITEIGGDLTGNLNRIREHGMRANQIVQSMLMMGRTTGEKAPTDVNALLSEHARLAYHNARVSDSDFAISVEEDLDPEIGNVVMIAQDVGRVFLNMVGNACYATDERRKKGQDDYEPNLKLTTRRIDDKAEIRIRDNGSGMPPEVIEKIFNPFFTTKPTDKGTGLGLSLSNDIVRQHGGTIRVESEDGSFTEFIIELPLKGAGDKAVATIDGDEDADEDEADAEAAAEEAGDDESADADAEEADADEEAEEQPTTEQS